MAAKDDTMSSKALKTLEQAISATENADLPLEEDHYVRYFQNYHACTYN
jgi:exonuclease VII small subunit